MQLVKKRVVNLVVDPYQICPETTLVVQVASLTLLVGTIPPLSPRKSHIGREGKIAIKPQAGKHTEAHLQKRK